MQPASRSQLLLYFERVSESWTSRVCGSQRNRNFSRGMAKRALEKRSTKPFDAANPIQTKNSLSSAENEKGICDEVDIRWKISLKPSWKVFPAQFMTPCPPSKSVLLQRLCRPVSPISPPRVQIRLYLPVIQDEFRQRRSRRGYLQVFHCESTDQGSHQR